MSNSKIRHEVTIVDGVIRLELWRERNGVASDRAVFYPDADEASDIATSLNFTVQDLNPCDPDAGYGDKEAEEEYQRGGV